MPSFQRVQIMGHVGRDVEVLATKAGKTVAKWSIAVDEGTKDNPRVTWFRCTAFEQTADIARDRFVKGALVLVEGSIREEKWTDKAGAERTSWGLIAHRVYFLRAAGADGPPKDRGGGVAKAKPGSGEKYNYGPPPMSDDDIPF